MDDPSQETVLGFVRVLGSQGGGGIKMRSQMHPSLTIRVPEAIFYLRQNRMTMMSRIVDYQLPGDLKNGIVLICSSLIWSG